MVRIFKVKELEDRKRLLLARSEMYRQTMRLEIANVRYSANLWKRKLNFFKTSFRVLSFAAPVLGLAIGRKMVSRKKEERGNIFTRLLAGVRLFSQLRPFLSRMAAQRRAAREAREPEDTRQFP